MVRAEVVCVSAAVVGLGRTAAIFWPATVRMRQRMTPAWMRVPLMALVLQALATAFQVGLVSRALKRQRAQLTAYHPERSAFMVLAFAQRAFPDLGVQTNCAVTIAGVMALAAKAPVHASRDGLGRSATTSSSWMDRLLVILRARARDNASMGNASVRKASSAQIVPSQRLRAHSWWTIRRRSPCRSLGQTPVAARLNVLGCCGQTRRLRQFVHLTLLAILQVLPQCLWRWDRSHANSRPTPSVFRPSRNRKARRRRRSSGC